MIPGQIITARPKTNTSNDIDNEGNNDIEINQGRDKKRLLIANTGDRPIQVGSHYHFYETNAALAFDREAARGYRLDIPAGTAIRFEPGQSREVGLVAFSGARVVHGFCGAIMGSLDCEPRPAGTTVTADDRKGANQ